MYRACVDRGNKQLKAEPKSCNVTVVDCTDSWQREEMHQRTFFNHYATMSKWSTCPIVALKFLLHTSVKEKQIHCHSLI